jgi:Putative Flp pilus-assembly TadE/G-like
MNGIFLRLNAIKKQEGQILPWMALLTVLFLGMAGLTIDLGRAYVAYRQLQASTDAAALAGAYAMTVSGATTASVTTQTCSYSSNTNSGTNCPTASYNGTPLLSNVSVITNLYCVGSSNFVSASCTASNTGDNVIQVTQTAVIPTMFIGALGAFGIQAAKTLTLNATSTATLTATNVPLNVAVVIDTTASMGDPDSDPLCDSTQIACALNGVQTLIRGLTPCGPGSSSATCTGAFDQVSIFTFPNVTASTAPNDTTCPTSNPSIVPYTTPAQPTASSTWQAPTGNTGTYQITGFADNYISNNQQGGSINTSSFLAIATGASGQSNCKGLQTPGGDGTYYAGAINAAETALLSAQIANPISQNIMIILSDGDANSTKIAGAGHNGDVYGSLDDQCQQAIAAAQNATSLGTTVYTVAYGAESSGCDTDKSGPMSGLSPCTTMQYMSSGWPTNTNHFFSDTTNGMTGGACPAPTGVDGLDAIFGAIDVQLSKARLIPNSAG